MVIVDKFGRPRMHDIWRGIPYIIDRLDRGAQVLKNHGGCRPYIIGKFPDRWTWRAFRPTPADIRLQPDELAWEKYGRDAIVLEPSLKARASPNKRWLGWPQLVAALRGRRLIQFPGDTLLPGVEVIETPTIRHACAVMRGAKAAVLHEGGLHHAAAAVELRAVVLFGGYIGPEHTGYPSHVNLARGPACGNRMVCAHCLQSMASISVADVLQGLGSILEVP